MLRIVRRALLALAVLMAGLVFLAAATHQGRTTVRVMLFLPQVLADFPLKPQEWVTGKPTRQRIVFPLADGGEAEADVYLPAGSGKHPATLFFLGIVPADRDEHRVVGLGEGLARAGVVVMIPWLESQTLERIGTGDVDSLVRAFQHLRSLDQVDPDRVGMGGICTGASLLTVAAQDERISDQVTFINFFAGYYDALDVVRAIGGRSRFDGGYVVPWKPDKLTLKVFSGHLVEGVTDPDDRDLLSRVFVDKQQASEAEVRSLGSEGMAVYRLLNGVPPEEVDGLIQKLSPETHEFLRLISPKTHIDRLKARMLIMHDRADRLVPSEESRRLVEALGEEHDTYYTEFSFFQSAVQVHMDEGKGVGPLGYVREIFKMFLHIYNVMSELS